MSFRDEQLEERRTQMLGELKDARDIEDKARDENRGLTAEEQARIDDVAARSKSVLDALAQRRHDSQVWDVVRELSDSVTGGIGDAGGGADKSRRLSFRNLGHKAARQMLPDGAKALAPSGSAVVAQEFAPDPIPLGRVATGLLDVLPVKVHTSPSYAYLQQVTRTNNAAVVAEGAVKPTSIYTLTRVQNVLAVLAHLSEALNRLWFLDEASLSAFIDAEMEFGLRVALEAKVLADINGTSGIQSQTFATSVLATLRKGITKLETAGYAPGSIVLHPTDWEGVELALSSITAVEYRSLPFDPAARRLYGTPVVVTVSQPAGAAHVLAQEAVTVDTDSFGVQVAWSENATADSFSRNQIFARCEMRTGTSVLSPLGVVTCALS